MTFIFGFRIDLTSDKRYSVSTQTKNLMRQIEEPMNITIYLTGDLNPGFFRLKRATTDLFSELSAYSSKDINIKFVDPTEASNVEERQAQYAELAERGLIPTTVYERDKTGKTIQKVIFPWAEIRYKNRMVPVSLLKNIRGNSGEQNLNISIENLEFEITDAIRQLTVKGIPKIAFIEGHGELSEAEVYDISKTLSRYFQIDRGILATDASVLDPYKVVVIAGPTESFNESEKFILDQYLMRGGRILWILNGVRMEEENLTKSGVSPAMQLDVNLSDQLFRYGVRIEPVLLQDVQSVDVPINIAPKGETPQFEATPWIYTPLLLTSPAHAITRNITEVRAEFPSAITLVGKNTNIKPYALLFTSDNTHIVQTPTIVNLGEIVSTANREYFNAAYIPVAVSLEGIFESNFANRITPRDLVNTAPIAKQSIPTRQIVVASKSIIRNETSGIASDSTTLPLGYDRYMNTQFGNKDFIQNAILYLADNEGWMELRSRTLKLRLLNKNLINTNPVVWQVINVVFPILLLAIFGTVFLIVRRRKYSRRV